MTQADATLPYAKGPVSVQVQLLHEGGIAGGSPSAHASAVMEAFVKLANSFVSQIRAARLVGARWPNHSSGDAVAASRRASWSVSFRRSASSPNVSAA